MRILVVEDEKALANNLKKGLSEEGYSADVAYDGEEGGFMAETEPYDLIILDIMLPKTDGITILRNLRKQSIKTPVLMLTAKDTVPDKIKGLDTGADDYLTKPFDFDELLARVRALLRRKGEAKTAVISIDDLEIDTAAHQVRRGGKEIQLSAREYALLEYLAYNRGKVVSRTNISEHIYEYDFDLDSNIIDVYINFLRNKIDKGYEKKLINTVRGAGYILKE